MKEGARKFTGITVIGIIIAAVLLVLGYTVYANKTSKFVEVGTRHPDKVLLKQYLIGKTHPRPETPKGVVRVGVVTYTRTKIEPWPFDGSFWHAELITENQGQLDSISIYVRKNVKKMPDVVQVGDYVAVFDEPDVNTSYTYIDDNPSFRVEVLRDSFVSGLPTDK